MPIFCIDLIDILLMGAAVGYFAMELVNGRGERR